MSQLRFMVMQAFHILLDTVNAFLSNNESNLKFSSRQIYISCFLLDFMFAIYC